MKIILISIILLAVSIALNLDIEHEGKYLRFKLKTTSKIDKE